MNDCKNKNYILEKVYHKTKANANIYSEILFVFLDVLCNHNNNKHMFGNTRGGFMRGNTLSGRRKMFGWTAVAFIAAVIILCGTIHIFASSGDSRPYNKYYTSVRVEEGDTVWSIADRYIADSQVSKRDYVDEICRLNSLADGNVRSGDYIVVSYYSQDIK